jgi:hypothetical protein
MEENWLDQKIGKEQYRERVLEIYRTRGGGYAVVSIKIPPRIEFIVWADGIEEAVEKVKSRIDEDSYDYDDLPF